MRWEDLREEEFDGAIARSGGLCVLPLGCLEKHGQHLPVGTDSFIAQGICELAAEREEAVVFPTGMWLGDMMGQRIVDPVAGRCRGAIALNPHTILTVLEELCDEIRRNGFRKILIVNSHGGNVAGLGFFQRAMTYRERDYAILSTEVSRHKDIYAPAVLNAVKDRPEEFAYITAEDIAVLERLAQIHENGGSDSHAGFRETAMMLGLQPDTCRVDKAEQESGLSTHRADWLSAAGLAFAPGWGHNFPNKYHGYAPVGCTRTIGRAVVQICVERMSGIYRLLKEDEDCIRMTKELSMKPDYLLKRERAMKAF